VSEWEIVRHQVAIAGYVTDAATGKPIRGAQVEVTNAPGEFKEWLAIRALQYGDRWEAMSERPDRTRSAADGHFHFLDLPAGNYKVKASLPGAGTRYGQSGEVKVSVPQDENDEYTLVKLPPTTVKGRITTQVTGKKDTEEPVAMAEVRVVGSDERAFSDGDGHYLLAGLEASKDKERIILARAQGFQPASRHVRLSQGGAEATLDFTLSK
jgi:hypothetical protein